MIHTSKRFWLTEEQLRDVMYSVIGISPYESQDPDDMKEYPIPDGEEILVFVQNNQACPVPSDREQVSFTPEEVGHMAIAIRRNMGDGKRCTVCESAISKLEELRKQGEQP